VNTSSEQDQQPVAAATGRDDFDVLAMCEIWLAMDFQEPSPAATPPNPEEAA
jgi:hypothetical protein